MLQTGEIRYCACGCGKPASKYFNDRGENKGWRGYATGHAPNASVHVFVPEDPAILAYFAGIIDGEGCIYATVKYLKTQSLTFVQLSVTMCSDAVIEWIEKHFGGSVYISAPPSAQRRERFHWQARGKNVAIVLRAILPYLIEKRQRALLGIQLSDMLDRGAKNISEEALAERTRIASQIKAYNQNLRSEDTVQ